MFAWLCSANNMVSNKQFQQLHQHGTCDMLDFRVLCLPNLQARCSQNQIHHLSAQLPALWHGTLLSSRYISNLKIWITLRIPTLILYIYKLIYIYYIDTNAATTLHAVYTTQCRHHNTHILAFARIWEFKISFCFQLSALRCQLSTTPRHAQRHRHHDGKPHKAPSSSANLNNDQIRTHVNLIMNQSWSIWKYVLYIYSI